MKKIREKWRQVSAIDRAVFILGVLWFLGAVASGFIWKDQFWVVLLEMGCLVSMITLMLIQIFRAEDITKSKKWVFSFRIFAFLCISAADLISRFEWAIFEEEIHLLLQCIGVLTLVGSFFLDELFPESKTDSEEIK